MRARGCGTAQDWRFAAQLAGILVTHEHIDHIRGVGVLSRKYDLPVYASEGTWTAMEEKLGGVAMKNVRVLEPLQDFYVGGMNVTAFDIPHDARPAGRLHHLPWRRAPFRGDGHRLRARKLAGRGGWFGRRSARIEL